MDCCPLEIWTKIFETACVDDGSTGRSLSVVSRFIRRASAPVKYQSICISNSRQLKAFSRLLNSDLWSPLQPVRMLLMIEDDRGLSIPELCSEYLSIMTHVANQLQIFCLYTLGIMLVPLHKRHCIHFPHLKSLYIITHVADAFYAISKDYTDEHGSSPSFPQLRHCKLRFTTVSYKQLFSTLIDAAPALDYLDISQTDTVQESDLLQALKIYYEIGNFRSKGSGPLARSPPTSPSIVLQLMTEPSASLSGLSWLHGRLALEQLATRDGRLKVGLHRPPASPGALRTAWMNGRQHTIFDVSF